MFYPFNNFKTIIRAQLYILALMVKWNSTYFNVCDVNDKLSNGTVRIYNIAISHSFGRPEPQHLLLSEEPTILSLSPYTET